MWIIDNQQMQKISESMRVEFEKRAHAELTKMFVQRKVLFDTNKLKEIIILQMENIIKYQITDENAAIEFIWLTINYEQLFIPEIQEECRMKITRYKEDHLKIGAITEYINSEGYVSKY